LNKESTDEELVAEANAGLRGQRAGVEMMRRLRGTIETLNQNLSTLLTAIHKVETRLLWYTVAILFFTVVLACLTGYDLFIRQKP